METIKKQLNLTIEECLLDMKETDGFQEGDIRFFMGYANFTQDDNEDEIWDNAKNKEVKLWISDKSCKFEDHHINYIVYVKNLNTYLDEIAKYLKKYVYKHPSGFYDSLEFELIKHNDLQYYIKIPIKRKHTYIKNEFEPEFNKLVERSIVEEKNYQKMNHPNSDDLYARIWIANENEANRLKEQGAKYVIELKDLSEEKKKMIRNYMFEAGHTCFTNSDVSDTALCVTCKI